MYQEMFDLHANLYKALSNSKRAEIIHLLRDQELSVSQMQEMLGFSQSNISQHLSVLREHGLVSTRRNGTAIYYKLAHSNIIKASDLMREMLIDQNRRDSSLSKELKMKMKDLVPVVIDPVCGMRVSPKTAAAAIRVKGATIYFCASGCKENFLRNKKKYIKNKEKK